MLDLSVRCIWLDGTKKGIEPSIICSMMHTRTIICHELKSWILIILIMDPNELSDTLTFVSPSFEPCGSVSWHTHKTKHELHSSKQSSFVSELYNLVWTHLNYDYSCTVMNYNGSDGACPWTPCLWSSSGSWHWIDRLHGKWRVHIPIICESLNVANARGII